MNDRQEHLDWCKQRALEYWKEGDLINAVASMGSDLKKHPDFNNLSTDSLLKLGMLCLIAHDPEGVRRWIEGFR